MDAIRAEDFSGHAGRVSFGADGELSRASELRISQFGRDGAGGLQAGEAAKRPFGRDVLLPVGAVVVNRTSTSVVIDGGALTWLDGSTTPPSARPSSRWLVDSRRPPYAPWRSPARRSTASASSHGLAGSGPSPYAAPRSRSRRGASPSSCAAAVAVVSSAAAPRSSPFHRAAAGAPGWCTPQLATGSSATSCSTIGTVIILNSGSTISMPAP